LELHEKEFTEVAELRKRHQERRHARMSCGVLGRRSCDGMLRLERRLLDVHG
jgi:hypothetical protein